jgi:3-oxoacyl-[acyl-carrier protein] reductase
MDLYGVTVNNVCPGYARTACLDDLAGNTSGRTGVKPEEVFATWNRLIPAGRIGTPEEFHRCRWRGRPEPRLAQ